VETSALKLLIEKTGSSALLQCVNFGKTGHGCAWIHPAKFYSVCEKLRALPSEGYDFLENLSAMQMDEVLVLTYFLRSRMHDESIIIRSAVEIPGPEEWVDFPSLTRLWPLALEFEKEIYELFGVRFLDEDKKSVYQTYQLRSDTRSDFPLRKTFHVGEKIETPDVGGLA
jgi:NADH:ubiquinone oxidoreductase subunit C